MGWLRWTLVGLTVISLVGFLERFWERREAGKQTYVASMADEIAKSRKLRSMGARFVGSFQTFDWLTFSDKPSVIIAAPAGDKKLSEKLQIDEMFSLTVVTYGSKGSDVFFVSTNCKEGKQHFSDVTVTKSTVNDEGFPRWLPALCGDWSKEIQARRSG